MSSTVIQVSNLSKQYRLGQVGTGSLSHDINRLWHRAWGKEDPYLKIGEENNREAKGNSDYVWALKDINFDIEHGDRVGIIGRNGAGKSTLLKILSRTTSPTSGSVKIKGRVASLLEVGTGFHPDLSGRDNIFLNGAILGMSKQDIKSRFDEIVDFAGVERYIDTPVKRYSSGMYVRLAFAVAAHLESDILIVDEVLAVGDAEFQKKCLGKMSEVSEGEGKTILFVSHNMAAIQKLCNIGILIDSGKLANKDSANIICDKYLLAGQNRINPHYPIQKCEDVGDENVKLIGLKVVDRDFNSIENIFITSSIGILVEYQILTDLYKPDLSFLLTTIEEQRILHSVHETRDYSIGMHKWVVWIPSNLLNDIEYIFTIGITTSNPVHIHLLHSIIFTVHEDYKSPTRQNSYVGKYHGSLRPSLNWTKISK